MTNLKIRTALLENNMKLYELAEELGIHEVTLSRRMRKEIPEDEQIQIVNLIRARAAEKAAEDLQHSGAMDAQDDPDKTNDGGVI